MSTLAALKHDYIEDIEISGKAELTAKRYAAYLDTFLAWLAASARRDLVALAARDLTEERLRQYRLHLARRRNARSGRAVSAGTRNIYLIVVRNFLRYLRRTRKLDVPDPEAIELAKLRDKEIRSLQRPEVERISEAVRLDAPTGLRDRAIVEALFGTACRVSELVALRIRQVDLARREAEVVGKGGRSRLVLLTEDAAGWIERYLATRTDDSPYLFVSNRRNDGVLAPISVRQVERIVETAAARARIPFRVTPHWYRHSRLTILARHAGVQAAQRIAGHSSLQTTARYLHVTDPQLRALYDRAEKAEREG